MLRRKDCKRFHWLVCVEVGAGAEELMPGKVTGKEASAQLSCDPSGLTHWLGVAEQSMVLA